MAAGRVGGSLTRLDFFLFSWIDAPVLPILLVHFGRYVPKILKESLTRILKFLADPQINPEPILKILNRS